ncbi:MAG: response regulator transcription factor [Lentisphaerae bacterium]|nr:response regulator transcription factor [Lentisphaerota bacterium]
MTPPDAPRRRILLVDDEPHIVDVVDYVLREQGFDVASVISAELALSSLQVSPPPDLVILDLGLPGMPGLDLLRHLRTNHAGLPVIILSARSEEIDRVLGLELGADDYVTKPFSARELAARVRAVLRRGAAADGRAPAAGTSTTCLVHGPLTVDSDSLTASLSGRPLTLTRAEFRLLECLTRHPARIFTRDDLINRLYAGEHVVTDRSVDACVKRLRRRFAELNAGFDPIQTVHGLGYKLNPDVERAP